MFRQGGPYKGGRLWVNVIVKAVSKPAIGLCVYSLRSMISAVNLVHILKNCQAHYTQIDLLILFLHSLGINHDLWTNSCRR